MKFPTKFAVRGKFRWAADLIGGPRDFRRAAGLIGALILTVLVIAALFPQAFAPYDPSQLVGQPLEQPGRQFLLGTNDIGQDLFSELIWGTRISLVSGLTVAALAVMIGTLAGIVSGFTQGWLSSVLLRLVDLTLVLPFLPLVILLSAYLGPSQRNVIVLLTLVFWAVPARVVRSRVLVLSNEEYIEAARAVGSSPGRIMRTHIWLGVRDLAIVQFSLVASASILAETSLSFLGLGNPSDKTWGTMLFFARASGAFLSKAWRWWVLPPGIMITSTVLSFVLIGYALEGHLAPFTRLEKRWITDEDSE